MTNSEGYVPSSKIKEALGGVAWCTWVSLHDASGCMKTRVLKEVVSRKIGRSISLSDVKNAISKASKVGLLRKGVWVGNGEYKRCMVGRPHASGSGWYLPADVVARIEGEKTRHKKKKRCHKEGLVSARGCPIAPKSGRVSHLRMALWNKVGMGPAVCVQCRTLVTWGASGSRRVGDMVAGEDDVGAVVPLCRPCARGCAPKEDSPPLVDIGPPLSTGNLRSDKGDEVAVPPFPGASHVGGPIKLPVPPLVDLGASEEGGVQLLASIYRESVLRHIGPVEPWVHWGKSGDIRKYKMYPRMVRCGYLLYGESVSPYAWADWVVGTCKKQEVVRVDEVFDCGVVEKKMELFWNAYAVPEGTLMPMTKTHRELVTRWYKMDAEFHCKKTGAAQDVKSIVNRHFPKGSYDTLVKKTKEEYRKEYETIKTMLKQGKWIWP